MEECVFCKIISGEIPSKKIYEDEKTYAFLDIAKDVDGHILVIPKSHSKNILDCDTDNLNAVINSIKTLANHLTEKCGYDGVNILNANNECAGQTVNHLHFHIIPRKISDGINIWPKFDGSNTNLDEIAEKLKIN